MAAVLLKLNQDQLEAIGTAGLVSVPSYDRSRLRAGILHFGVGNFHRAHQASFLDELFARGLSLDWAIVGAGVMPSDAKMREQLAAQDFLSTVVELESEEARARVIGPMVDFLPVGDSEAIIGRLADQDIRIVSLTITEGGYFIDPATGGFNAEHPSIQADAKCRDKPSTVFGLIVAGLRRRWQAGLGPLAVMSCDNIPHNGTVTRNAVLGMAALWEEPALVDWICREVAFPSGMVDRITPATGDRERRLCRLHFGLDDGWPVFCEQFKQWVLEDNFPAGRPALEEVGVQFVPDVRPYELMKIRILNGGHAMVAYASALLDIHFVHDAIRHPLINGFVRKVLLEEVVPSVPPVPGIRLAAYLDKVIERMANSGVGDTVGRLCFDGSNRQPKFIVPSIADGLRMGKDISGLALASALWCRYCVGSSEAGKPIGPNDPNWDRLEAKARLVKANPVAWLAMEDIYGEVAKEQKFRAAFAKALRSIWEKGTEVALREYLES